MDVADWYRQVVASESLLCVINFALETAAVLHLAAASKTTADEYHTFDVVLHHGQMKQSTLWPGVFSLLFFRNTNSVRSSM